ncbi:MAG: hypothetical protein V9G18_12505 [Albidovulum sp.]
MISEITLTQLAGLTLTGRPLVICDVDEVVVHFTRDFEAYLDARGLWLDTSSFALNGNIRQRQRCGDRGPRGDGLIDRFFVDRTRHLEPIDGAVAALQDIGETADVVLLTNLPHSSGDDRRENLRQHGLPFPVVTNSGPKGPAIRQLAHRARTATVFVDDSPSFIASCLRARAGGSSRPLPARRAIRPAHRAARLCVAAHRLMERRQAAYPGPDFRIV